MTCPCLQVSGFHDITSKLFGRLARKIIGFIYKIEIFLSILYSIVHSTQHLDVDDKGVQPKLRFYLLQLS